MVNPLLAVARGVAGGVASSIGRSGGEDIWLLTGKKEVMVMRRVF